MNYILICFCYQPGQVLIGCQAHRWRSCIIHQLGGQEGLSSWAREARGREGRGEERKGRSEGAGAGKEGRTGRLEGRGEKGPGTVVATQPFSLCLRATSSRKSSFASLRPFFPWLPIAQDRPLLHLTIARSPWCSFKQPAPRPWMLSLWGDFWPDDRSPQFGRVLAQWVFAECLEGRF